MSMQMKPRYFDDLLRYPKSNPVFITVDWASLHYIRRSGICLLCEKSPTFYDFSFCYQREMWVLYSHQHYFHAAMQLAQALQQSGAKKILVLFMAV
jgi:hypothetical protein